MSKTTETISQPQTSREQLIHEGRVHADMMGSPYEALNYLLNEGVKPEFPLDISRSRGKMPVLVDHRNNGMPLEDGSVTVVANSGSFGHNEGKYSHYYSDSAAKARLDLDEEGDGPITAGFSRAQDTLVLGTRNPEQTTLIIDRVRATYQDINVGIAETIQMVPSIHDYMDSSSAPARVLPHVLDPRMAAWFGSRMGKREEYFRAGLINSIMYTKTADEMVWSKEDVATPPTMHDIYDPELAEVHAAMAVAQFDGYDEIVISNSGGLGGSGVFMVPRTPEDIVAVLRKSFRPGMEIMNQGRLETLNSPCVRATLLDGRIRINGVSMQRFIRPGEYGGNETYRGISAYLEKIAPDFWQQNIRALLSLQRVGVRGKVNVDSMVVSPEEAAAHGLDHTTFMREGNIRPAYSSTLDGILRGTIDGAAIDRVHFASKITMPHRFFEEPDFLQRIRSFNTKHMRLVVVNYDYEDSRAAICFAGTANATEAELSEAQTALEEMIAAYSA